MTKRRAAGRRWWLLMTLCYPNCRTCWSTRYKFIDFMGVPTIRLARGIHVMHLFYKIDRVKWTALVDGESKLALARLQKLSEANNAPSNPRLVSYVNVGGKADLGFMLYAAELGTISQMQRDLEASFPPGILETVYTFLSVTE